MKNRQEKRRNLIQLLATVVSNGYILGFFTGKIFTGPSKQFCVPGLNCYSCPGALGSCPIGALQAVLGGRGRSFSYYVVGTMLLFGVLLGRFICGFLCPFGLLQDLLHKIPSKKLEIPQKLDKPLRFMKYAMLLVAVILLPIFLTDVFGTAPPYFCKWICPVGTLEGGLPLIAHSESLRAQLGFLFHWKLGILAGVLLLSVLSYRPFCKYLCPLGAFYGLLNKHSLYQMQVDQHKCTGCKSCEQQCKMKVELTKNINVPECIRCGACKAVCAHGAIGSGFCVREQTKKVSVQTKT